MKKTLFISKKITDNSFLSFCKEKELTLLDEPMISFKPIPFEAPKNSAYDAIFFSSKRSVNFFFAQVTPSSKHFIGSIGKVTAKAISDWGYKVDFIGENSGNPSSVAKLFKKTVGDKTILFPQSNISNRSIQQELDDNQVLDIVVYETFLLPRKLNVEPSVLVFTSPSNISGYLQFNTINMDKQQVIAWGNTTAKFMKKNNITPTCILTDSSIQELQEHIKQLI